MLGNYSRNATSPTRTSCHIDSNSELFSNVKFVDNSIKKQVEVRRSEIPFFFRVFQHKDNWKALQRKYYRLQNVASRQENFHARQMTAYLI